MKQSEIAEVEKVQEHIDSLSPGQREVLRAWIVASYDVRGNWVAHNYGDIKDSNF